MEAIDPKILSKIKKCLALSGSDNPHEAAAALRQANAMMEKHGVSSHQISMSDIGEATVKSRTMSRDKPAAWEMHLAGMVGKAFGCKMMLARSEYTRGYGYANDAEYVFVGLKQQAAVAAYTANVLIRKCKSTRQKWLADNVAGLSKCGKGMKSKVTRMGDVYANGWVISISKLVSDFANPPEIDEAIKAHIDEQASGNEAKFRSVKKEDLGEWEIAAASAGMRDAKGESLYRPMGKNDESLMLEAY